MYITVQATIVLFSREYYHVLFSNLRVMIHAGDIFDGYFGSNGFE